MEYVYAALILHETGAELNEQNLTGVLESAGETVDRSRVKAIVAALEDVDLAATKAKTMAPATGDGESRAIEQAADDDFEADADEAEADAGDDDSQISGSLGSLFEESDESGDEDDEPDLDADPGDGEVESTDETEA